MAGTCRNVIADLKGTLLNKNRSHGTASLIKLGLDDKTTGPSRGIGLKLQYIRCEQDHIKQVLDTLARLSGYRNKYRTSAPILGNELVLGKLLFNPVYIGTWFIYLVDRYYYFNTCCLGMVDSLNSLRHYSVIGRNNKYGDIRRIGTPHTHGSEGLMSGSIKEGYLLISNLNNICTDVLGDTARLTVNNICLPYAVKKGGLTMVNVSHYTDNGRTLNHLACILFIFLKKFLYNIDNNFLLTQDIKLDSYLFCLLVAYLLINGNYLALQEQLLNDDRRLHLHLIGKILDGKRLGKGDDLDLLLFLNLSRLLNGLDKLTLRALNLLASAESVLVLEAYILTVLIPVLLGIIAAVVLAGTLLLRTECY